MRIVVFGDLLALFWQTTMRSMTTGEFAEPNILSCYQDLRRTPHPVIVVY